MNRDSIRYIVTYTGRVQGVGFRMTALNQARGLDVHGFVRNQPDGSVLMDVEGSASDLKELMARIDSAMSGCIDHAGVDQRAARGVEEPFHIQH